jgi:hypothetical protein
MRKGLTGFATLMVLAVLWPAIAQENPNYVTVRATPGLPNAAIEYIARVSEPRKLELRANRAPEELIAEVCGSVADKFLEIYDELNKKSNGPPPRARVQIPRTVSIPACIRWDRAYTVTVEPGNTVDSILLEHVGRSGTARLTCPDSQGSPRCDKTFRAIVQDANPGRDLDKLMVGDQIVLPFVTRRTTFKVKQTESITAQVVVDKIFELGKGDIPDSPLIRNFVAPSVHLTGPVAEDDIGAANTCKQASQVAASKGLAWPYDSRLIARVIERNLRRVDELRHELNNVTVTIVDTGLDQGFPEELLSRDASAAGNPPGHGIFLPNHWMPFPNHFPREVRLHGTRVAEIATGAPAMREALRSLRNRIRLKVVNIVENFGRDEYVVTSGGVDKGMAWARRNSEIANVSIGSETELDGFVNAMKADDTMLAVVAAGNEKARLGQVRLYPANYGGSGEIGTQVITVGAYDGSLARATFSNRSRDYVDFLAPGCDIPYKTGEVGLHGTSFAAPIVSMTTALLKVFGVGLKAPAKIKLRLHASSDFDAGLGDDVLWSSRLNIPKALSVYDDVVEDRFGTLRFGRWQTHRNLEVCAEGQPGYEPIAVEDIKKINVLAQSRPFRIRVLYTDTEGKAKPHECEAAGDGLMFLPLNDQGELGAPSLLVWSEIRDVVPRYYRTVP